MELKQVKSRLEQLGHVVADDEDIAVTFIMQKVEEHIYNFCNVCEVPANLEKYAIDNICGEYLKQLRTTGKLTDFDVSRGLQEIKIGDTDIKFNGTADDHLVDILISTLIDGLDGELLCYRKIKW